MTTPAPSPDDREALAEFLHTAIQWADHPSREPYVGRMVNGEVTVDGTVDLLNVADRLMTRWRLVPVERDLPGPDWDDPNNPKIARGSVSAKAFEDYLDASADMGDDD